MKEVDSSGGTLTCLTSLTKGDTEMIKFNLSRVINRSPEDVFAYVTKPENRLEWQSEIEESRLTSEGPMGVGSTFRYVRRAMGRGIEIDCVITEFEPGKKYAYKSSGGPVNLDVITTVEPASEGTKLNIAVQANPTGGLKLAGPLVRRMVKQQLEGDFDKLKSLLESRTTG